VIYSGKPPLRGGEKLSAARDLLPDLPKPESFSDFFWLSRFVRVKYEQAYE
jgi:hypothetical protein